MTTFAVQLRDLIAVGDLSVKASSSEQVLLRSQKWLFTERDTAASALTGRPGTLTLEPHSLGFAAK